MIKIIDIDALFDKYISDYVYKNIGKVKPEEIENQIPILYEKFGKEKLDELDGKTPETYYTNCSASELLDVLKKHVVSGVSVPDFLVEAITKKTNDEKDFYLALNDDESDEYICYLMNILSDMDIIPTKKYMEFLTLDYPYNVKELATELLSKRADEVKEDIIAIFSESDEERKELFSEILSYSKKDDKTFDILTLQFVKRRDKTPLYAGYLARFGDERALPFLMQAIEEEKISYSDFEELRFAIEALGGTYDKIRDFSSDRSFKKIKDNK